MSRDFALFLEDIVAACDNILDFTRGMTFDDFQKDIKTIHAVVRNLEVMGEAVKRLPDDFKAQNKSVEWRAVAGLRDILIHEYFGVNNAVVWDIIINELPSFRDSVKRLMK